METFTKDIELMTMPMEKDFLSIKMDLNTPDNGLITHNREKVLRSG